LQTYTCTPEFSTNIRVSVETYELLQNRKREGESLDATLQRELDDGELMTDRVI
jgi:hypothetical protein